jgi:hypothetical protein
VSLNGENDKIENGEKTEEEMVVRTQAMTSKGQRSLSKQHHYPPSQDPRHRQAFLFNTRSRPELGAAAAAIADAEKRM